jgi:hypothetical protein
MPGAFLAGGLEFCVQSRSGMATAKSSGEREDVLNDYVATSIAFADSVTRLRDVQTDTEAFIHALEETGTAHRACERSRIRLSNHLGGGRR